MKKATNQRKSDRNERRRTKRLLKHLNSSKPPRTPNRFILYRKYVQNNIFSDPNNPVDMRELSKVIAKMWEQETPEVKNYWDQIAEREKLNSSYRSSFDVISGVDMTISMLSNDSVTFVNAFAPPSTSVPSQQNEISSTASSTPLTISNNFIIESPELSLLPGNPGWSHSPQLISDDDSSLNTSPSPSISSIPEHLFIDPSLLNLREPEYSNYFSTDQGFQCNDYYPLLFSLLEESNWNPQF